MNIQSIFAWIARSRDVARSRRQLAALDDRALEDLGLTMADVAAECARPFWDWRDDAGDGHRRGKMYTLVRRARLMRH